MVVTTRTYYEFMGYEIDPYYAAEVIQQMWEQEPIGTISICLTMVGLLLGLTYKLVDIGWDIYKDRSRQGRLKLELSANPLDGVQFSVSNIGKEPVVVRQIGYLGNHLLSKRFIPLAPIDRVLPKTLHAKELMEITIHENLEFIHKGRKPAVKDSTGKIWPGSVWHVKTVKRQVRQFEATQKTLTSEESPELARV